MPVWRETLGWRQVRAEGGSNYIALRKDTGNLMCEPCMSLARSDYNPDQRTLM